MNRYAFLAAALTGALFAPPVAAPAQAGTSSIQRCESADGSIGYTDKSCAIFGSDAVTLESKVVDFPHAPNDAMGSGGLVGGYPVSLSGPGRRAVASGCARTPTQLQMDLRGAFALGDVNRIAESYHWVGMSAAQARTTMDRLQQLAGESLLDTRYHDAAIASGAGSYAEGAQWLASAGGAGAQPGLMQLVVAGDGAASAINFDVHHYKGCYFISF